MKWLIPLFFLLSCKDSYVPQCVVNPNTEVLVYVAGWCSPCKAFLSELNSYKVNAKIILVQGKRPGSKPDADSLLLYEKYGYPVEEDVWPWKSYKEHFEGNLSLPSQVSLEKNLFLKGNSKVNKLIDGICESNL